MILLLATLGAASAADYEQHLAWDVTLDGKHVGERTLTVKFDTADDGTVNRILEMWTDIDATVVGFQYRFRERLTGFVSGEAASFTSVTDLAGSHGEVQARKGSAAWTMTVSSNGREWTKQVPGTSLDLSTADLVDPDTRVPLSRFDHARVLSAETGDILEGDVARLGPSTVDVAGTPVAVDGYGWASQEGSGTFYYTSDGYLVRYEIFALGKKLVGTLKEPPPHGLDDAPVEAGGQGVTEVPL